MRSIKRSKTCFEHHKGVKCQNVSKAQYNHGLTHVAAIVVTRYKSGARVFVFANQMFILHKLQDAVLSLAGVVLGEDQAASANLRTRKTCYTGWHKAAKCNK